MTALRPMEALPAADRPVDPQRLAWLLRRVALHPQPHPLRALLGPQAAGPETPARAVMAAPAPSPAPAPPPALPAPPVDAEPAPPTWTLDDAAIARRLYELPPLPRALDEALRLLRREDLSPASCISAIEQDPALAARVLRLANSPFYGAGGRVSSIVDGVQLLGVRTTTGVVIAVSMRDALAGWRDVQPLFEGHWVHSVAVATAARELAHEAAADPDEAFLTGLLHDIGRLVVAAFAPARQQQAQAQARTDDVDLQAAERHLFGRTHDDIGAAVARHWRLPASIVTAIAAHHAPGTVAEPGAARLAATVHVADAVAHAMDLLADPQEAIPPADPLAWGLVGLREHRLRAVMQAVRQGVALLAAAPHRP